MSEWINILERHHELVLFMGLFMIAVYGLNVLGYMRVFAITGIAKPWCAIIPFYNLYLLAAIAVDKQTGKAKILESVEVPGIVFKFWWLLAVFISLIPTVGSFLYLLVRIMFGSVVYEHTYKYLKTIHKTSFYYISGIVSIIPLLVFLFAKEEERNLENEE